jgi:hypothetical protein
VASTTPSVLELNHSTDGSWEIVVSNRSLLIETLGEALVAAFCRCFVHADRLSALLSFAYMTTQTHSLDSATFSRNLDMVVWFTAGTLREFEHAIDGLVQELRAAQIPHAQLPGWSDVQILHRWSKERLPQNIRNSIAFHVDKEPMLKGVRALAQSSERWVFAKGDDATAGRTHLDFGRLPLLKGLSLCIDEQFIREVRNFKASVPAAFQQMFVGVLEYKGLRLQSTTNEAG